MLEERPFGFRRRIQWSRSPPNFRIALWVKTDHLGLVVFDIRLAIDGAKGEIRSFGAIRPTPTQILEGIHW